MSLRWHKITRFELICEIAKNPNAKWTDKITANLSEIFSIEDAKRIVRDGKALRKTIEEMFQSSAGGSNGR